jgi:hypothetical protein
MAPQLERPCLAELLAQGRAGFSSIRDVQLEVGPGPSLFGATVLDATARSLRHGPPQPPVRSTREGEVLH